MREDAPNRRRRLCVTVHGAAALHRWASTPSASCWKTPSGRSRDGGVHQAEGCQWLVRRRHRSYPRCDSPHASGRGSSNRMARSNRHRRRRTGSRRGHPVHERHVERHHAHRRRGDAQRATDKALHTIGRHPQIGHQRDDLPTTHLAYPVGELTVATVLAAHRRHYIAHPQKLMA
jgi:hypothetical protein